GGCWLLAVSCWLLGLSALVRAQMNDERSPNSQEPTADSFSSTDLLRRPLDDLVAFAQTGDDFDVQSVADAGLDLDLLRRSFRCCRRELDGRPLAAVLERDQALGAGGDVLLLADDHVVVRGR